VRTIFNCDLLYYDAHSVIRIKSSFEAGGGGGGVHKQASKVVRYNVQNDPVVLLVSYPVHKEASRSELVAI